jgi:hypothetical protein
MMIFPELAGLDVTQFRFEIMTHRTLSLLAGLYAKTGEFVPALDPLTIHWYVGNDPPLPGVALKVTVVPGQKGFEEATIVTPAGMFAFTTMVIVFDWAGFPEVHVSEDASEQVTTSPFSGV